MVEAVTNRIDAMAQITEDFAEKMLKAAQEGRHTPLTCWEEAQLAWTWLKAHGYSALAILSMNRKALLEDYPVSK